MKIPQNIYRTVALSSLSSTAKLHALALLSLLEVARTHASMSCPTSTASLVCSGHGVCSEDGTSCLCAWFYEGASSALARTLAGDRREESSGRECLIARCVCTEWLIVFSVSLCAGSDCSQHFVHYSLGVWFHLWRGFWLACWLVLLVYASEGFKRGLYEYAHTQARRLVTSTPTN